MLTRRILRILNILIAFLVLALVVGGWWLFWRPMPQTSGDMSAPVAKRAEVRFDALGVPHILAASQDDAFFIQGFVTASERLWQMDALRRSAAGDLSEIVGPVAIDVDKESHQLRMRRIAEAAYTTLTDHDRADLAAYARGVNFFIDTHQGKLPFEFALIGYQPRPWSVVDSILIGLYMFRDLTTSWDEHLKRYQMARAGDPAKVAFLYPVRAGTELIPGSNAWVVSGAHTTHGHPQLSDDMHLRPSLPGIWFMTALEAPGLKVSGVALPGVPGVIVGHNDRIAWGVTNLGFNVQDLYREKLDERTGQYEYQGHMEQARLETDLIPVKGQKPVEVKQWVTRHGPVLANENGEHFAMRWTAAEPGFFAVTFIDVDRARNWDEFNKAVAQFPGPGQNFVYADIDGNIGYHASGKLPIRHNYAGDEPVDGASGQFEWDGYIPYDQLPSAYNPPGGILVTANQNPFPVSYKYTVSGGFASPYRSRQIYNMLLAKGKVGPEDTLAIEKDVYSAFEDYLAHALVQAWDKHPGENGDLKPAIDQLRAFNGQLDKDSAAALIVVLSDHYLRHAMAESAAPGKGNLYADNMSYAAAEKLLRERPAGWFPDYDGTLLTSLRDAVREAERSQGHDRSKWRYGSYLQWNIDHPVVKNLPLLAGYLDLDHIPMSGGSTTVKQTGASIGPSERFNAVVGDWDKSILNIPFGQSGHPFSGHYKDEWDAYYNGRSFPMQFNDVDARSTLVVVPQ